MGMNHPIKQMIESTMCSNQRRMAVPVPMFWPVALLTHFKPTTRIPGDDPVVPTWTENQIHIPMPQM